MCHRLAHAALAFTDLTAAACSAHLRSPCRSGGREAAAAAARPHARTEARVKNPAPGTARGFARAPSTRACPARRPTAAVQRASGVARDVIGRLTAVVLVILPTSDCL